MRGRALLVLSAVCLAICHVTTANHRAHHETAKEDNDQKTTVDYLNNHHYPNQLHHITTEDGYVLEVHRITGSPNLMKSTWSTRINADSDNEISDSAKNNRNEIRQRKTKDVVFLMHGLLSSSADWVVTGPGKSLAMVLADLGYDVWLGNARGNRYSRKHISLDPDEDSDFWEFSWHEIGTIDLPAMIEYILSSTGNEQLTYVGHSQGTTSYFVMTSELPEYNDKIRSMHALAPVAYMKHVDNPYVLASMPLGKALESLCQSQGAREMFQTNEKFSKLTKEVCSDERAASGVCVQVYLTAAGFDPENVNKTLIPDIMQNVPAGASSNQLVHYYQLIGTDNFRQLSQGFWKNLMKYNSIRVPKYDLGKISSRVALYWGENDDLATPKDVERLSKELKNVVDNYRVDHDKFTHVDFLYALNVDRLLNDRVIENIQKFAE